MKSRLLWPLLAAVASLTACLGNSGSSMPPPTTVAATAGDTYVTVSWDNVPGVVYFLFYAYDPSITALNWTSLPNSHGLAYVTSPATICGQVNGTALSATVDARTGTSPGGSGSPSVTALPRSAGDVWKSGTPIGATVRAVALAYETSACPSGGIYAAVGPAGVIYWSNGPAVTDSDWTNGGNSGWTAVASPVAAHLNAVAAYTATYLTAATAASFRLVAVGDGGAVVYSTDGKTWSTGVPVNAGSAGNPGNAALRAIAASGSQFIAVGDGGVIESSSDGITWAAQAWPTNSTPSDLHAIRCVGATCYALGNNGLMLQTTTSGASWTAMTVGSSTLRQIAYGDYDLSVDNGGTTLINTWVAVGDNGTYAYSANGAAWTTGAVSIGTTNLVDVAYTSRFIAVDAAGNAFANPFHAANPSGNWSNAVATRVATPAALLSNGTRYLLVGTDGSLSSSF